MTDPLFRPEYVGSEGTEATEFVKERPQLTGTPPAPEDAAKSTIKELAKDYFPKEPKPIGAGDLRIESKTYFNDKPRYDPIRARILPDEEDDTSERTA